MKIISWNINGIRASIKTNDFYEFINKEDPDIFCLGETKITPCKGDEFNQVQKKIKENLNNDYYDYWSPCTTRKGYSGTAIFTKKEPKKVILGMKIDDKEYDEEGRVITCEFNKYYLIHVYTPNSGQVLARLDYRVKTWDVKFREYIEKFEKKKPVILCGDLNVAHHEIDLKNPKTNLRTAGFTIEERESFDSLLNDTKLIDSFRYLNKTEVKYSYWSYRFNSRNKNAGWRIDYFLVSPKLIKKVTKSDILTNVMGSDHAPIIIEIKLSK
jgi:exodeoxyribonuclease-3